MLSTLSQEWLDRLDVHPQVANLLAPLVAEMLGRGVTSQSIVIAFLGISNLRGLANMLFLEQGMSRRRARSEQLAAQTRFLNSVSCDIPHEEIVIAMAELVDLRMEHVDLMREGRTDIL